MHDEIIVTSSGSIPTSTYLLENRTDLLKSLRPSGLVELESSRIHFWIPSLPPEPADLTRKLVAEPKDYGIKMTG